MKVLTILGIIALMSIVFDTILHVCHSHSKDYPTTVIEADSNEVDYVARTFVYKIHREGYTTSTLSLDVVLPASYTKAQQDSVGRVLFPQWSFQPQ